MQQIFATLTTGNRNLAAESLRNLQGYGAFSPQTQRKGGRGARNELSSTSSGKKVAAGLAVCTLRLSFKTAVHCMYSNYSYSTVSE